MPPDTLSRVAELDDLSLAADFLGSVDLRHRALKLESAVIIMPMVNKLLASPFEEYVSAVGVPAL